MKKIVRIVAVALVAVMLCCALVACSKKLSGTYEAEIDVALASYKVEYEFSGSKVTVTTTADSIITSENVKSYEGTYEIKELDNGKMEITLDFETEGTLVKSGTYDFSETDDGDINIAGVTYKKQK